MAKLKSVKQRIADGMAALDQVYGPDWVDKIDLDKLDLANPRQCIVGQSESHRIGQVFGVYGQGITRIFTAILPEPPDYTQEMTLAVAYGFDVAAMRAQTDLAGQYRYLNGAWRRAIRARRAERAL
jgi:hypothetical protein